VLRRILPSIAALSLLCLCAAAAQAGRIPCTAVLSELDRLADETGGEPPGAERVARTLKTDSLWVQRCAQTYGRRVTVAPSGEDFNREDQAERFEAEEAQELAPEEKQARGDVYPGQVEDEKRRPRKFGEDAHEWEPFMQKPWEAEMQEGWQPTLLDDDL
jgi:hypothetical protein